MLKGAIPVWIVGASPLAASFPGGAEWCRLAVGFSAIAGHVWTVFAGFKGGKGVATAGGVALTRYISLGSILGALAFAAMLAVLSPGGVKSPTFAFGALVALLVVVRHKDNIARLLRGEERRF